MLYNKLCDIGLNENEARVYLELIKLGPQAVSIISKCLKLNRTTTYSVLKSLQQKGLVSSYKNGGVKYFAAEDPNTLIAFIDQKYRTYEYYRNELLNLVPKFRALAQNRLDFNKPVVSYYEGIAGVKTVMFDALNAEVELSSFLPLHKWLDSNMIDFLPEYQEFRITNKKVKLKAIVPDKENVRDFFSRNYQAESSMTSFLFADLKEFRDLFNIQMNIYNGKVAILNIERGFEYGVTIECREVSHMLKKIFNIVWKYLKTTDIKE